MRKLSAKGWIVAGLCSAAVAAGAAAEFSLLPRALPRLDKPLKDARARTMTPAELDALLVRAARKMDPPVRQKLAEAVLDESSRDGYDPLFILALVSVESRFRISANSERGAAGLMQLKPSTFAWIAAREPDVGGEDAALAEDPVIDVRLAIRYFRWLEHRFHSRDEALMAYNAGPRKFLQYRRAGEIPDRLREYPRRVMKEYQRFVRMANGGLDMQDVLLARNR